MLAKIVRNYLIQNIFTTFLLQYYDKSWFIIVNLNIIGFYPNKPPFCSINTDFSHLSIYMERMGYFEIHYAAMIPTIVTWNYNKCSFPEGLHLDAS